MEVGLLTNQFKISYIYQEQLYQGILNLMCCFCPLKLWKPLLDRETSNFSRLQIERLLFKQLIKYPELDFDMDAKFLAKSLAKTQAVSEKVSIAHKISFMVRSKGILSFMLYFDGRNMESFEGFRWCLQLLYHIERYAIDIQDIRSLLEDCQRIFSILCAKSLINRIIERGQFFPNEQSLLSKSNEGDVLQGLLFTIMECTEPSMIISETQLELFVLSKFFEVLGDIESCMAVLNGFLIECIYNDGPYNLALRLQRSSLNEMIRKYIFGTTMTVEGDPTVMHQSGKIIEAIILYGGIHIDILRFFHAVYGFYRSSFMDAVDYIPESVLTRECISMVDNIIKEWDGITSQCDPKTVQLPQVLLRTTEGSIVMVEEVLEESLNEHRHEITSLLSSIKLRTKRRLLGETQVQNNYSIYLRKLGVDWVTLWEQSYLDNNDDLPADLLQLASDIKQWSFGFPIS